MTFTTLVALVLLPPPAAVPDVPSFPQPGRPGYVAVPVTVTDRLNAVYLSATVGGRPVVFLVDTGATNTSVSSEAAGRLGLKTRPGGGTVLADGSRMTTALAEVTDFRAGLVRQKSMPVEVADMTALNAHHQKMEGRRFDGIIGGNFLKVYRASIDYGARQLLLYDPWAWDRWQLQGTWVGTSVDMDGSRTTDPGYIDRFRFTVRGDECRFAIPGLPPRGGEFRPDPLVRPKRFAAADDKPTNGSFIGLYEIADGMLKVMIADGWSPDFDQFPARLVPTPRFAVFTFRREKDDLGPTPETSFVVRCLARVRRHHLSIRGLAEVAFPPDGEYRFVNNWSFRPNRDGTVTAQNAQRTIRVKLHPDGTFQVETVAGLTLNPGTKK